MPRKSAESRGVTAIMTKRPAAPACLAPPAAKLWREIVQSRVPDYFDAGNLPLLQSYCACVGILERTEIGTATHKRLLACVVMLATKLRLTVQQNVRRGSGVLDERSSVHRLLGGNVAPFKPPA